MSFNFYSSAFDEIYFISLFLQTHKHIHISNRPSTQQRHLTPQVLCLLPLPRHCRDRWIHLNGTKVGRKADPQAAQVRLNGATDRLLTALLTMADECFKSALPAHYSSVFHDSSLALPAVPTPQSASKVRPNDRSRRVHQQVQLTLARRARNSGNVHLHVDKDAHICSDQADSTEEARLET